MRNYKIVCLLLVCCLLLPAVPAFAAAEAAAYSPEKALGYAKRNWADFNGNCIPFASRCLQEGGVGAVQNNGDFGRFIKKLDDLQRGKMHPLTTMAVESKSIPGALQVARTEENAKLAMAGDLVFWYCEKCKAYTHVGLIGEDKNGFLSIYARNREEGNRTPMQAWCYTHGGGEHIMVYAYHISREEEPAQEEEAPPQSEKKSKSKKKKK